jgi:ribonuclease VapC
MVIDSSAIIAILLDQKERAEFDRQIETDRVHLTSAVGRAEADMVIGARMGEAGRQMLDRFLRLIAADIVAVTPQQAELAMEAFRRFGKGRHRAGLNIGDCFAYAAAAATGEPLLFKGDDFAHTDVQALKARRLA